MENQQLEVQEVQQLSSPLKTSIRDRDNLNQQQATLNQPEDRIKVDIKFSAVSRPVNQLSHGTVPKPEPKPGKGISVSKKITKQQSLSQQICLYIMLYDESSFIMVIGKILKNEKMYNQLCSEFESGTQADTCFHMATLTFMKHPFFLEYLLNTDIPMNHFNNDGLLPWFLLCHYHDDREFEKLFNLFMKHRPSEMNLNIVSPKGKCKNKTLYHIVMAKCPTLHKLKMFIDYEYDFKTDYELLFKTIDMINNCNYNECGYEEREKIVETLYNVTEAQRKLEFVKIIESSKNIMNTNPSNRIPQGLKMLASLTDGKLREIAKYI
ncbi:UNKNOWN [Stylonychia lemnae]|uniref:Uncharacterized protein n=1 Tax=Stylonychia lemnae TaxID=5949 RepID=A0A078AQ50_STYLE|nr:UNKNOWN [Stylonychia lemnae]|eukprot:CDW83073.1 UNKNOWN [Stylonychia lemnae]